MSPLHHTRPDGVTVILRDADVTDGGIGWVVIEVAPGGSVVYRNRETVYARAEADYDRRAGVRS